MDPIEWPEPRKFIPERFDPTSKWFKRADGTNRNPQSFCPFLGGKRVCLGKTFAEVTVRFTLPLYFHYFEYEFEQDEHKEVRPVYVHGSTDIPKIPVIMTTRNKVT